MFHIHIKKMREFMSAIAGVEDADKPITYYNLRNLSEPLSNDLIKGCLDFCLAFGLLHRCEVSRGDRVSIHYHKTIFWPFLEAYVRDN
jgi:hypothetical protein